MSRYNKLYRDKQRFEGLAARDFVSQYTVLYCDRRGGLAWLGLCHDTTDCIMTGGLARLAEACPDTPDCIVTGGACLLRGLVAIQTFYRDQKEA